MSDLPYFASENEDQTALESVAYVHAAGSFLRALVGRFQAGVSAVGIWDTGFVVEATSSAGDAGSALDLRWDVTNGDPEAPSADLTIGLTITEDPILVAENSETPKPPEWDEWTVWVEGFYDQRVTISGALSGPVSIDLTVNLMRRWGYRGMTNGLTQNAADGSPTANNIVVYAQHAATNRLSTVVVQAFVRYFRKAKFCTSAQGCFDENDEEYQVVYRDGRWNCREDVVAACALPVVHALYSRWIRPLSAHIPQTDPCNFQGNWYSSPACCDGGACAPWWVLTGVAVTYVPALVLDADYLGTTPGQRLQTYLAQHPVGLADQSMDAGCYSGVYPLTGQEDDYVLTGMLGMTSRLVAVGEYFDTVSGDGQISLDRYYGSDDPPLGEFFGSEGPRTIRPYTTSALGRNTPFRSGCGSSAYFGSPQETYEIPFFYNDPGFFFDYYETPYCDGYGPDYFCEFCGDSSSCDPYCAGCIAPSFIDCGTLYCGDTLNGSCESPEVGQLRSSIAAAIADIGVIRSKNVVACLTEIYKSDVVYQPYTEEQLDPSFDCDEELPVELNFNTEGDPGRLPGSVFTCRLLSITGCSQSPGYGCTEPRNCTRTDPFEYDCSDLSFYLYSTYQICAGDEFTVYGSPETSCYGCVFNACNNYWFNEDCFQQALDVLPITGTAVVDTFGQCGATAQSAVTWEQLSDALWVKAESRTAQVYVEGLCENQLWVSQTVNVPKQTFEQSVLDTCSRLKTILPCENIGCGISGDQVVLNMSCTFSKPPGELSISGLSVFWKDALTDEWQSAPYFLNESTLPCPRYAYHIQTNWVQNGLPTFASKQFSNVTGNLRTTGGIFPLDKFSQVDVVPALNNYGSVIHSHDEQALIVSYSRAYVEVNRPLLDGGAVPFWAPITAGGLDVSNTEALAFVSGGVFRYRVTDVEDDEDDLLALEFFIPLLATRSIGAAPAATVDSLSVILRGQAYINAYPEGFSDERNVSAEEDIPYRADDEAPEAELDVLLTGSSFSCNQGTDVRQVDTPPTVALTSTSNAGWEASEDEAAPGVAASWTRTIQADTEFDTIDFSVTVSSLQGRVTVFFRAPSGEVIEGLRQDGEPGSLTFADVGTSVLFFARASRLQEPGEWQVVLLVSAEIWWNFQGFLIPQRVQLLDRDTDSAVPVLDLSQYMRCFPVGWYTLALQSDGSYDTLCCKCDGGVRTAVQAQGTTEALDLRPVVHLGFYGPVGAPPGSIRVVPEVPETDTDGPPGFEQQTSSSSSSSQTSSTSSASS